jgi:HlyD family secretion protein
MKKMTPEQYMDKLKRLLTDKRFLIPAAILIIAAAALLSLGLFGQKAANGEFFTEPVERGPIRNVVNATGTVQAVITVQVGSQVSGQIQALYADFNSIVKRGQLLAKIDPRNFEAQVENAKANLAAAEARVQTVEADLKTQLANLQSAKANLEAARVARDNANLILRRYTELAQSGVLSQNEFDTAKANADSAQARYNQAQAAVEQVQAQINAVKAQLEQSKAQVDQARADLDRARVNLEYTNIYSPVDGVVVSRNVDVGQTVAASLQAPTLFVIANDLTKMQVNANVDEADIGKISDRVDVKFTVDAYPNDTFSGRITEIRLNPQTIQNVVTYSVIINVDNPQLKLKPGMTANITITVDQRDSVLKVPNAALRYLPPGMTRDKVAEMLRQSYEEMAKEEQNKPAQPKNSELLRSPQERRALFQKMRDLPEAERQKLRDTFRHQQLQLAPGQLWDPAEKIKFPAPRQRAARPAIVWMLNSQKKPEPRRVLLGITDGASTEVISGDIKEGDLVIVGDTTQASNQQSPQGGPPTPFGRSPFGPPRPAGGGRR